MVHFPLYLLAQSSMHSPGRAEQMPAELSCQVSELVTVLESCSPLHSAWAQVSQCHYKVGVPQPIVLNASLVHRLPRPGMQKGQNKVLSDRGAYSL